MSPIEPSATSFRGTWPFAVRLATLFIALCAMWFATAFVAVAIDYLTAQPTHPKAFALVDQWLPPETIFGVVVAVVLTFQFYLRAPPNVGGSARTGAWIIGAGLIVLGALLLFAVNMVPEMSHLAAWMLRSVATAMEYTAGVSFCYAIFSIAAERRRQSRGA